MKFIETHARTFLALIILSISSVTYVLSRFCNIHNMYNDNEELCINVIYLLRLCFQEVLLALDTDF